MILLVQYLIIKKKVSQREFGAEISSFMDFLKIFSTIFHVFMKINEYAG